jgi:hypothetical protein
MSLVRLLTAGKSLVGIQDSKSRYRSVDPRAMPKFGSEKKSDLARESEAKPSVADSNVESSKANTNAGADNKVGITQVVEKTPVATAPKPRGSGWVSQWGSKLSSLVSPKPKPAKSGGARFSSVPVQGELSLDNIKVVRNDLSDADLEVVTRKMAPAKKAESESQEWTPVKNVTPTFVSANSGELAGRNVGVTAQ